MQITIKSFLELRKKGITLDLLFTLSLIGESKRVDKISEFQVYIQSLEAMKYIDKGTLTPLGIELLEEISEKPSAKVTPTLTREYVYDLHKRLKDRMKELTGSAVNAPKINGKSHGPFIPGGQDLYNFLTRFIKRYGFSDQLDKIEQNLFSYLEARSKENHWFPQMKSISSRYGEGRRIRIRSTRT